MSENIPIRDASGATRIMRTSEFEGVQTPVHIAASTQKKFRDGFALAIISGMAANEIVVNWGYV